MTKTKAFLLPAILFSGKATLRCKQVAILMSCTALKTAATLEWLPKETYQSVASSAFRVRINSDITIRSTGYCALDVVNARQLTPMLSENFYKDSEFKFQCCPALSSALRGTGAEESSLLVLTQLGIVVLKFLVSNLLKNSVINANFAPHASTAGTI